MKQVLDFDQLKILRSFGYSSIYTIDDLLKEIPLEINDDATYYLSVSYRGDEKKWAANFDSNFGGWLPEQLRHKELIDVLLDLFLIWLNRQ